MHPTWAPRSNDLTHDYYRELDIVKDTPFPVVAMYEPGDNLSVASEFGEESTFGIETVSDANAKPVRGWDFLVDILLVAGAHDIFVAGMNINFWVDVDIGKRPGAVEFNKRYADILKKLGARSEVPPVQCLGSLLLELTVRLPDVNLHFTRAMYPAYFVPIGSRSEKGYPANLSAIPDLPEIPR